MNRQAHGQTAIALVIFSVTFMTLTMSSYTQKSATADEPDNLTAGYAALKLGDYRLDPMHPPLLRMWAALPLLAVHGVDLDTNSIYWLPVESSFFSHEFMYQRNDADQLLCVGRFMIVLLGLLLGVIMFCWAQRLYGFGPAVAVLALYTTEPNILAHASLVTTDLGVTCFMFGALYFLWRTIQHLTWGNLTGLMTFFTLAQVSKYSALALWPVLFLLLLIQVVRRNPWPCSMGSTRELGFRTSKMVAALTIGLMLFVVTFAGMWAIYGFRYAPAPEGSGLARLVTQPAISARVPRLAQVMDWADAHHLLPNACAQGFLAGQGLYQRSQAFFMGHVSDKGWWYYFPVVFLIKTPISLLILFFGGVLLARVRHEALIDNDAFILVPLLVYLAFAMTSHLNIGLRHILPIYPFVLLIAGKAVAQLWMSRRKTLHVVLGALCLFQVEEVGFVCPHYLAFFNQFIGGPRNGYRYVADSNLDWGQDLKLLMKWMNKNGIQSINLGYFGSADPGYYGINCRYLPGSPFFVKKPAEPPQLPGYVAVSVQRLHGIGLEPPGTDFYRKLLESEPVAVIGYSIRVYWVERPWW
jgi:hypothetical protein